jgi:hypothetical protein
MVQRLSGVAIVVASITTLSLHVRAQEPAMKIGPPENMTRVGSVEERYQFYNIEMLEVTGGMFWKPYGQASNDGTGGAPDKSGVPAGMDADLYEYRPPVDLSNGKLRKLAAALGPAYVRVSRALSFAITPPKGRKSFTIVWSISTLRDRHRQDLHGPSKSSGGCGTPAARGASYSWPTAP